MNPYEPPHSDEPAPEPRELPDPESGQQVFVVVGLGAASVVVRWVLEFIRLPFVDWWAPVLIGVVVGNAAVRGLKVDAKRQWMLLALAVTGIALGIGAVLPLPEGAIRLIYVAPNVGALSIAAGAVVRVKLAIERAESSLTRDADQRALFARRDVRPLAPSRAPARFACAGCGELFVEAALTTVDGKRRCESCAG